MKILFLSIIFSGFYLNNPVPCEAKLPGKISKDIQIAKKSSGKPKNKKPPSTGKPRRQGPNAKILYNNSTLMSSPDSTGRSLIKLQEGDSIRISNRVENNYVHVLLYKKGKRYTGWIHLENIHLTPEVLKKLRNSEIDTASDSGSPDQSERKSLKQPFTGRPLEKTLMVPRSLSLFRANLNFNQSYHFARAGGAFENDVSRSNLSMSLIILFGVSDRLNLEFEVPYRIEGKERIAGPSRVTTMKTRGMEDFSLGFRVMMLKQEQFVNLNLIAGWKSGFMSDDLPVEGERGGAGDGSHDFFLGFDAGKSFRPFSPHLSLTFIRKGPSTRHAADDSFTEKYDPNVQLTGQLGFEIPQFLPLIIVDPYLGYSLSNRQIVITNREEVIDAIHCFSAGMQLFVYRNLRTYIFHYKFSIEPNHASRQYSITHYNGHAFSAGVRF